VDNNASAGVPQGWAILSPDQLSQLGNRNLIVGIGDNDVRKRLHEELCERGHDIISIVDPLAVVSESAKIGQGVYVGVRTIVNARATISDGVILNTAAVIEHDCHIHAFAHIAPNATLTGGVEVGKRTLVGAGAVVLPGVKIADDCIIGAGAVVTKDVPNGATVVGNPARLIQPSGYPHDEHDHMTGDGTILA